MKLVLLRHGATAANEAHVYCGAADPGLSAAGKTALINRKKTFRYPGIRGMHVITSGMKRCEETLSVLYGDVPHETDCAFREMNFGVFEMRSYEELKTDPLYLDWIAGDNETNIAPGGESGEIMTQRVRAGLERLLRENRDVLLVTHGGVIAAIMSDLFPAEKKNRYEWQPSFGGGYVADLCDMRYGCF